MEQYRGMASQTTGRAHHPVLVVMGVSGSGKSTVAGILAGALKWDLQEGDDLHPDATWPRWRPVSR